MLFFRAVWRVVKNYAAGMNYVFECAIAMLNKSTKLGGDTFEITSSGKTS